MPARWNQQTKLDDSGAVWDFIQRLEKAAGVSAYDISLTAESSDGQQNVEYSGALDGGYDAAALKSVAEKLQEIVSGGSLRMTVGSLGFPTGQALLDWLKATNQPFNARQGDPVSHGTRHFIIQPARSSASAFCRRKPATAF